jgi:predicted transcriptional regulator
MDFNTASRISSYLSKDYAEEFFRLLVKYQDISASEAASRLGLHIRTAQDFLEGLAELEIIDKKEVHEKKRPYFRYTMDKYNLIIDLDLTELASDAHDEALALLIRESQNARANFTIARSGDCFSAVTIWEGEGREREERRINLTTPQGKFLFHLPFPKSKPLSIAEVMEKAGVDYEYSAEIQDIVNDLERREIIEIIP